jgi:hypothetical protein
MEKRPTNPGNGIEAAVAAASTTLGVEKQCVHGILGAQMLQISARGTHVNSKVSTLQIKLNYIRVCFDEDHGFRG